MYVGWIWEKLMVDSLGIVQERSDQMIAKDADNVRMMEAMDDMWHMRYTLPEKLRQSKKIRKEVSSDPHDALRAGTRVLGSVLPNVRITPLAPNAPTRAKTDEVERAVKWVMKNALRRRGRPLPESVRHAMQYDRICGQLEYLPEQDKALKIFNKRRKRLRNAERNGPFAILIRDPKFVHADWSDWGLERVVHRSVLPATEVIDFWGKQAAALKRKMKNKNAEGLEYVTVYDYTDLDQRIVWCVLQEHDSTFSGVQDKKATIIMEEENKLDFIPWVIKDGGDDLMPLLYSIYRTKAWQSQCIYETIMSSEVIAYAAAPREVITSPNPNRVTPDYEQYGTPYRLFPGEKVERILPPDLNQNMQILSDRKQQAMAKSTIPNIIQSSDFPGEWAWATANLATQSGIKSLTPYKELAEEFWAEVVAQILYWIDYSGDTLEAYPAAAGIEGALGAPEQVVITKDDFNVEALYIDVELTADVPTDQQAKINAAAMAKRELQYPNRRALEAIDVDDPGAATDEWFEEQRRMFDFQEDLKNEAFQNEMERQMEMQQQQGLAQENQQMQGRPQQQQQQQRIAGGGGQAANPALGGQPPIQIMGAQEAIGGRQLGGTNVGQGGRR
jgi:hypothetical protein